MESSENWKDEAYDTKKNLLLCKTSLIECINTLSDDWKQFYDIYHFSAESHDSHSIMCKCGTPYVSTKESMHKKTKKHTKWAFETTGLEFKKKWNLLVDLESYERVSKKDSKETQFINIEDLKNEIKDLKNQLEKEKTKTQFINIEDLKNEIKDLKNQLEKEKTKTDSTLEESGKILEQAINEAKAQKQLLINDPGALKKLKLKFHPDVFQSTKIGNDVFTAITKALN